MKPDIRPDTATITPPSPVKPLKDLRGFWRVLLAVVAPLPMLAMAVNYLLNPVEGDAEFEDMVTAIAANQELVGILRWFGAVFVFGIIPATFAVAWVARRGAPRLATIGAVIALTGFLAGTGLISGGEPLAYFTAREGVDVAAAAMLDDAAWSDPIQNLAALLFILGVVFGLLLLGLALWRSRVAPAWMGIALMVGGFTHPFVPGHVAQGVGLAVAAVGFAGASVALLRMRNDEFDLPPAR
jgi:hypothetical protein